MISIIEPIGGHGGGMHYYDFGLSSGVAKNDVDVVLYTCEETESHSAVDFKLKKYFKGIWGKKPKIFRAYLYMFGLIKSLIHSKLRSASIVHIHIFHYTTLERITVFLIKLFSFKLVITVHDVESFAGDYKTNNAQSILSKADLIICHSKVSKCEVIDNLGIQKENVRVIPHGNHLDLVKCLPSKIQARKQLGLESDDKVILFFGQIKTVKGLDILLEALPHVELAFSNVKLLIAGKVWKDNFEIYDQIINRTQMSSIIQLDVRYISDDEVSNYYCASDLVVLPYRKIYQSGVLLMAMSHSTPVVASDIPGLAEMIDDEINGLLFESENHEDLSKVIIKALNNPGHIEAMAQRAFEVVKRDYDWDCLGKKTLEAYREVIDNA